MSTLISAPNRAWSAEAASGIVSRATASPRELRREPICAGPWGVFAPLYALRSSRAWSLGDLDIRLPGAESGTEVFARYDEVIDEIARSGVGTAAVFSHGTVIRTWAATRAGNLSADFAASRPLTNTGVVVLEGSPRAGWRAVSWNGQALGGPVDGAREVKVDAVERIEAAAPLRRGLSPRG